MFDMLGGLSKMEETGKAISDGFATMIQILGQIRDDQAKSREALERIANAVEDKTDGK